jgi:flagellar FliJ protein
MTHDGTATLALLLEQAERERDAARADLQRAEDAGRRARDQAQQLADYRQHSVRRWGVQPGRTGSAAMLHCVHGFMQRLDQATFEQRRQCEHLEQQVLKARQRLQTKETRVASVEKLIQRRRLAEAAQDNRRAQKQLDEAAQRMAWDSRTETNPF